MRILTGAALVAAFSAVAFVGTANVTASTAKEQPIAKQERKSCCDPPPCFIDPRYCH